MECQYRVPKGFTNRHNTKVGTWAKLIVLSGQVKYYALDESDNVLDTLFFDKESDISFVEPQAWHKIEALGDGFRCQLSFYCQTKDYYQKNIIYRQRILKFSK